MLIHLFSQQPTKVNDEIGPLQKYFVKNRVTTDCNAERLTLDI